MFHENAIDAIREAQHLATLDRIPVGVAWHQGDGWKTYPLTMGTLGEPEFVCLGQGTIPVPLTETAAGVWHSILRTFCNA